MLDVFNTPTPQQSNYQEFYDVAITHVNNEHALKPFDFGVMNGDIIHDNVDFLGEAKKSLDKLTFPYYVTKGNHDIASPKIWEQAWTGQRDVTYRFVNFPCD